MSGNGTSVACERRSSCREKTPPSRRLNAMVSSAASRQSATARGHDRGTPMPCWYLRRAPRAARHRPAPRAGRARGDAGTGEVGPNSRKVDAACLISTGVGTRRVHLVRGGGGRCGGGAAPGAERRAAQRISACPRARVQARDSIGVRRYPARLGQAPCERGAQQRVEQRCVAVLLARRAKRPAAAPAAVRAPPPRRAERATLLRAASLRAASLRTRARTRAPR